jgi:hypothetical protein
LALCASMIVTSNPFSGWAEIVAFKGGSYRLRDRDLARPPAGRLNSTLKP